MGVWKYVRVIIFFFFRMLTDDERSTQILRLTKEFLIYVQIIDRNFTYANKSLLFRLSYDRKRLLCLETGILKHLDFQNLSCVLKF